MTDYDDFARSYADENERGFFNEWYERPETLRLAGDVCGLRVLDAGCGSGPLAAAGFRIATISEPSPAPGTPTELLPGMDEPRPFIGFLFFALEAV